MHAELDVSDLLMTPNTWTAWNGLAWCEKFEARNAFRCWVKNTSGNYKHKCFIGDTGKHLVEYHIVTVWNIEFRFAVLRNDLVVLCGLTFLTDAYETSLGG